MAVHSLDSMWLVNHVSFAGPYYISIPSSTASQDKTKIFQEFLAFQVRFRLDFAIAGFSLDLAWHRLICLVLSPNK